MMRRPLRETRQRRERGTLAISYSEMSLPVATRPLGTPDYVGALLRCHEGVQCNCLISACFYCQHRELVFCAWREEFRRNRYACARAREVDTKRTADGDPVADDFDF